jgi:predicted membrane metal-binding protein
MGSSNFAFAFNQFLQGMGLSQFERSLFLMVGAGQYGAYSNYWAQSFRELACLHLLVLSGSQVNGLAEILRFIFGSVFRTRSVGEALWIYFFLISLTLIYYAACVNWSPPITRATFFWMISTLPFGIGPLWSLLLAFVAHVLIFPEHLLQVSFFLSWISFLLIHLCSQAGLSNFWTRVVGTNFCMIISQLVFFEGAIKFDYFLTGLAANLLLGFIFEQFFSGIMSVVVAGVLLKTLLPIPGLMEGVLGPAEFVLAPFFRSAAAILLVALRGLRYIGS